MNKFNALIPLIGGDAWRETLIKEKVALAKDLSFIDRRLAEIEIELSQMGTVWNDSVQERAPEITRREPVYTIVGQYSIEAFDQQKRKDTTWYQPKLALGCLALIISDVEVWPIKETTDDKQKNKVEVMNSNRWKAAQAFELSDTHVYDMQSTDRDYDRAARRSFVFVEYTMGDYIGFFVDTRDIQLVKLP